MDNDKETTGNKIDKKEFYRVKNTDSGEFVGGYNKNVWAQKGAAVSTLNSKGRHNHNLVIYTATAELSGEHVVAELLQEKEEKKVKAFQGTINNLKKKIKDGKIIKTYENYSWTKPATIWLVRKVIDETITILDVNNNREFEKSFNALATIIKKAKNYEII